MCVEVLLQQAAWEGVLRQVRGCARAALPCVELPLLSCVQIGRTARPVR